MFLSVTGRLRGMSERLVELGQNVQRRRLQLGLSKDAAAAAASMSPITWTRIENGQPVRLLSLSGVERVLGWEVGSCVWFIEGRIEDLAHAEASVTSDDQPVGLGLDAEADGLPSEDVEAIRAQVRALKRARGLDA